MLQELYLDNMGLLEDKRGSTYSVIMIALMLFMVGFVVANFLKSPMDDARADLKCSDAANISDGTKWMCLAVDMTMVYFIILIISIAGGVIVDKLMI